MFLQSWFLVTFQIVFSWFTQIFIHSDLKYWTDDGIIRIYVHEGNKLRKFDVLCKRLPLAAFMLLARMSAGLLLSLKAWPCLPPTFITLGADFAVIFRCFSLINHENLGLHVFYPSWETFCVFLKLFASPIRISHLETEANLFVENFRKTARKWPASQPKDQLSSHVSLYTDLHLVHI